MVDCYEIELRHRARTNESHQDLHRNFMGAMSRYDAPWGYKDREMPKAPEFGENLTSVVELRALSGKNRKSYICYLYRSDTHLKDKAQFDDIAFIRFESQKIDTRDLFQQVFPAYIEAFGCYRAAIASSDFDLRNADWDRVVELCNSSGKDVDGRDGVYRFHPANFFDRELCRRAFDLTPEQIVKRLEGKVEKASMLNDGVLIIYSTKLPATREEYEQIDREIKPLLK